MPPYEEGDTCGWLTAERTVCTALPCLTEWAKHLRELERRRREKNRKRSPAEVHQIIIEERRARRRRSGNDTRQWRKGRMA